MGRGGIAGGIVGLGIALLGSACAGPTRVAGRGETNLRGSVPVSDAWPHLLVAGPAVVLHMNLDARGGDVTVYRVVRLAGNDTDCGYGPQHDGDVVEMKHAALVVADNESLCATATRPAWVSWHARKSATPPALSATPVHASLR